MTTINDEILRATGGPTINDGLASWFARADDEALNDAEHRWLIEQGATPGQINDMWVEVFGPGQINDVKLAYWSGQADPIIIVGIDMTALAIYLDSQGWVTANITATQFDETLTASLITEANMLSCVFTGIPAPLTVDLKDGLALQGKVCP